MNDFSKAVVSYGNNSRLKKAINKARLGRTVKIVFLGASITAPPFDSTLSTYNYTSYFEEYFKKKFGNAECINSGICGSDTPLGLYRIQTDVISHDPDIVFIDFGISDYASPQLMECYEGMLRILLNHGCAVIPVFMSLRSFTNSQAQKIPFGLHYDLMMISVRNLLKSRIEEGLWTWDEYSKDYAHPTNEGHKFISQCIEYGFDIVDDMPCDDIYIIPKPYSTGVYENSVSEPLPDTIITHDITIEKELICSRFVLIYHSYSDLSFGTAEVLMDGKPLKTIEGYNSSGWGNRNAEYIFSSETAEKHTFTIRMCKFNSGKSFHIAGLLYC